MSVRRHPTFKPGGEWHPVPLERLGKELEGLLGKSKVSWRPNKEKYWIIDPLAYYIPFSTDEPKWGIKLMVKKMLADWRELNNWTLKSGLYFPWSLYVSVITLHELGHHIVEECFTRPEDYFTFEKDARNRQLEEGLCEYTAFAILGAEELELNPLEVLRSLFSTPSGYLGAAIYGVVGTYVERWYFRRRFLWPPSNTLGDGEERLLSLTFLENEYSDALLQRGVSSKVTSGTYSLKYWLSILYYWWNRSDPRNPYRPRIDPEIWNIVGPRYEELLTEHLENREYLTKTTHQPDTIWRTIEFVPSLPLTSQAG